MSKLIKLINKRFGKLLVRKRAGSSPKKDALWLCKCDCGKEIVKNGRDLRYKDTLSCGCLRKNNCKMINFIHGDRNNPLYMRWKAMLQRCNYKKHFGHKYYTDKGIIVCKRWNNYLLFKKDMEESFLNHCKIYGIHQTTLDRINSDSDYNLKNCRWATYNVQNNNNKRKSS